ncbi:MAG: molybdopterin molybdotransferase MoeA [Peptococcaceae bacterium]|nr:molybdopterin molybdotransferase MoeA [Peptococcaceae bacterium]
MNVNELTTPVQEAMDIVLASVKPLDYEIVSIIDAYNRVLYQDIVSNIMIPSADDSAMDGYAVIAEDTYGASSDSPVTLQVVGEVRSGGPVHIGGVSQGKAVRIMTGAVIPKGANSVIEVEYTEEDNGYVRIFQEAEKYKNYRIAGESIKKGDKILRKGTRLSSADIGILASLNHNTVNVYRQATVSIISTGDELVDLGNETQNGQIRDANAYVIYSEVKKLNAVPRYLGITKDTLHDVQDVFFKALESDVVISTGGVSKGKYDFVKKAYGELGIETLFENVNVKPGKPCTFGTKGNRLVFGLPGNPVSALTSFIQFVRPALLRLMGAVNVYQPVVNAYLEEDIKMKSGRVHLLRGQFTVRNNDFYVATTGNQKSSILSSMSKANCLIMVPEHLASIKAGEKVPIQLINHS